MMRQRVRGLAGRRSAGIVVGLAVAAGAAIAVLTTPWASGPAERRPIARAPHVHGLAAPREPSRRAPTVFVAPGGSGDCSRAAPCATLDAALHAARPGAAVELAAGAYPEQVLTADDRKAGSTPIAVRPAPGARVRLGGLRCGPWSGDRGPAGVELADMTVGNVLVHRCDRITLRRMTLRGGIFLEGASNFAMVGGSVGPGVDYHSDVAAVYRSDPPIVSRNILFDGVRFHDWILRTPGEHIECLQVSDVRGLTVRRSRFERCDTFDLHIDGTVAGPVRDVVIENNVFGPTGDHSGATPAYYSLSIRDGIGVRIAGNVSPQAWALPARSGVVRDWTVEGNTAPMDPWQCDERIRWRANRWTAARCGPSDRRGPLPARVTQP